MKSLGFDDCKSSKLNEVEDGKFTLIVCVCDSCCWERKEGTAALILEGISFVIIPWDRSYSSAFTIVSDLCDLMIYKVEEER